MISIATAPISTRLVAVLAAIFSGSALACVDSLQPGHWCMVSNSQMESVEARPPLISQSLYNTIQGSTQVKSVMKAWSGGSFDTTRNRLVVWGGGHADYFGNEVYAFDVSSLAWTRLTLPSAGAFDFNPEVLPDGRPASLHTYDGLEYIPPPVDRMFARGNSFGTQSDGTIRTWFFNFDLNEWEQKADFTAEVLQNMGAYDPVSGLIYTQGTKSLYSYNPGTDRWTYLQANAGNSGYRNTTMAIDPKRRKMVSIGDGMLFAWDLTTPTAPATALSTSGATEIVSAQAPGFVYDSVSDRFVAWNGGSPVYSLNMDTLVWTKVSAASGNAVTPTQVTASGGTFGRFQYIPSKNAFIAVNATDENVYFYKLSAGSGGNPPAAPARPTVTIR
jgi:hypothetical protein